jgi:hypothetical protein
VIDSTLEDRLRRRVHCERMARGPVSTERGKLGEPAALSATRRGDGANHGYDDAECNQN